MTKTYEIPLIPQPQTFSIALAGTTYRLTLKWNAWASAWVLDIADSAGNGVLYGIPLVANSDLLVPYGYLNFGGQLVAQTDSDLTAPPAFDNLGSSAHLYFVVSK